VEAAEMASFSSLAKLSSVAGMTVVVFLLDWFYMIYITSHGFDVKAESFTIAGSSVSVPLQWLPVVGIIMVAFAAWYEVSARIFPRRGLDVDPLGGIRLLRAVAVSLALFIFVLYVPYLIGSNWFWARLSELSKSFSQIRIFSQSVLNIDESAMSLSPLWQYSVSQVLAAAAMVLSAWAFARIARRPRKR
jgi:hypothetical protein